MRVNKTPGRVATIAVDRENVNGVRSGDVSSTDHLTIWCMLVWASGVGSEKVQRPRQTLESSCFVLTAAVELSLDRKIRWLRRNWYAARNRHSWASASRPMPMASVFRHPASQSGTIAFRYRTRVPLLPY
jgi:hypothetical protein